MHCPDMNAGTIWFTGAEAVMQALEPGPHPWWKMCGFVIPVTGKSTWNGF